MLTPEVHWALQPYWAFAKIRTSTRTNIITQARRSSLATSSSSTHNSWRYSTSESAVGSRSTFFSGAYLDPELGSVLRPSRLVD